MTNELEKQFFQCFGIEKIIPCYKCSMQNTNWNCKRSCLHDSGKEKRYPTITDRHYLELILVYSEIRNLPICYSTVEGFKEAILECFIEDSEDFKHQVRTLFEEG